MLVFEPTSFVNMIATFYQHVFEPNMEIYFFFSIVEEIRIQSTMG